MQTYNDSTVLKSKRQRLVVSANKGLKYVEEIAHIMVSLHIRSATQI